MGERGRVTASNGLRLRDSPRDGMTLEVIAPHQEVEVLGRETWLRVKYGGRTGFVLADHIEPLHSTAVESVPAPAAPASGEVARIITLPHSKIFRGEALRIDEAFRPAVDAIAGLAGSLNIALWITSSLREPYKPIADAVVAPAKFSNHHVGHAFDMNVVFEERLFTSKQLGNFPSLPGTVKTFLRRIESRLGLRWGGNFASPDPVHIDDDLNRRDPDLYQHKLRTLWGAPPGSWQ